MVQLPRRGAQTHSQEAHLTWRDTLKIAYGELRLSPRDFYALSERDFLLTLSGHRDYYLDQYKAACELQREASFLVAWYTGNMKKGMTKYHFMRFSWDDKHKSKSLIAQLSGEERKQAAKDLYEAHMQKLNNFLKQRN